MDNETISYALLMGLAIALVVAIATDLTRRKIYNWNTFPIVLAAPAWWWAAGFDPWPGMAIQVALAVGIFLFGALLFAIGAMAAGDTKLMTGIALWFPPMVFLEYFVFVALFGGVVTLVFGGLHIIRRKHLRSGDELADDPTVGTIGGGNPVKGPKILIPYGIAVALAGLWILFSKYPVFS
ncbi:hypothetical protein GCM10010923_18540 [Blastomonas marina]|jgi:prepilin peptidase CpaA|uniref:Prepilin type IV endopeptidase peptidase domain-containing protein n=1 Tax=Blastomonas marina TaxID=1867408 RepID=A0ABQ1FE66_9SPHN|nr:prepilin peptidase [Blastomonas marina]GGA08579.1 hypothetical protein GCM10010923_18540 [Blastomonas marina]